MDFVEGDDLQSMLDKNSSPLSELQVTNWLAQICDALAYLHLQNPSIIHRDLKPANIKITPQGKAVLVDFGIAKVYDPVSKTTKGARAVTEGYSPIEQYGHGSTYARSDVYALGATIYTLLTNQVPPESVQRAMRDTLVPLQHINPGISSSLSFAITHALQVDPDHRFQTAREFADALKWQTTVSVHSVGATVVHPAVTSIEPQPSFSITSCAWVVGVAVIGIVVYAVTSKATPTPVIVIASPAPTALAQEFATSTLQPTREIPTLTLIPTRVPPTNTSLPLPSFGPIRFCADAQCSAGSQNSFPQGTREVFFSWSYQNMRGGMSYGRKWYVNGDLYLDYTCAWGSGWPSNGTFLKRVYDYDYTLAPGEWRIESYIEGRLQATAIFTVRGPIRYEKLYSSSCTDTSP